MKRLFGGKKEPVARPTVGEATDTANKRDEVLGAKIKELDKQLSEFKVQLKTTRPGPAQNRIKQRAMQVLKQKRMYESQQDQVRGVVWNMEQAKFATENVQGALYQAEAFKDATAALKNQMKGVKISELEDVMDDMADLMEDAKEISDIMSRSYAVDDDIDEAELEDELEALDEQFASEEQAEAETPAYLLDKDPAELDQPAALPAGAPRPAAVPAAAPRPAPARPAVDEFGLPVMS